VHPAFEIVARGAQVAQFLRAHHLIALGRGLHRGLPGGDVALVQLLQPGLARRDVERQLVIESERLFIEHVKRLDVLQEPVLMAQEVVGDLVDLALHLLEPGGEPGKGGGAAQQLFPPGPLAAHIQFRDGKAPDRGDDAAKAVACRPHILVAHTLQHGLGNHLQFGLRGRAERDDGLGVGHVDFGHAAGDFGAYGCVGLLERHDGVGVAWDGQDGAAHGLDIA